MRTRWKLGILLGLLCGFLIMPQSLVEDILGARIYFGTAPVFFFSVAIYLAQGSASLWLFRKSGIALAIGYTSVLLIGAYSTYELAFKLSFLLFGPGYVEYFASYDIYPSLLLAVGIGTLLAIHDSFRLDRSVLVVLSTLIATWILWLMTGNFPFRIQAYEANPNYTTLLYNYATKLLDSAVFLFAAQSNPFRGTPHRIASV